MKICVCCKIEKSQESYDGKNTCIQCRKQQKKKYKDKNREVILEKSREYAKRKYHEDPEKFKNRHKEWIEKNPEKYKESDKKSSAKSFQKYKIQRVTKAKLYRDQNREKVRLANRIYKKKNYDKITKNRLKYQEKYPEKPKAVKAINNAIYRGLMVKPNKCSRCECIEHIEGHHPDYSKPLEVIWLCRECHNKEHRK